MFDGNEKASKILKRKMVMFSTSVRDVRRMKSLLV